MEMAMFDVKLERGGYMFYVTDIHVDSEARAIELALGQYPDAEAHKAIKYVVRDGAWVEES